MDLISNLTPFAIARSLGLGLSDMLRAMASQIVDIDQRLDSLLPQVAECVASGAATSRAAIAAHLEVSRSSVAVRVDTLLASGLLKEQGQGRSAGGRPPTILGLNPDAGAILAVDLGASHLRAAVADLGGVVLEQHTEEADVSLGPAVVLDRVAAVADELISRCGRTRGDVVAVGMGLPGPVDHAAGAAVRPPIMPGWDGYSLPTHFARVFNAPVAVDNDVNVMALGEKSVRRHDNHLLFVKVGTGIGCGIISDGVLHRGADGAAGDIGHIRLPGQDDAICHCGNTGCLEAVASGSALVRDLAEAGLPVAGPLDVVALALRGDIQARRAVRVASRHIGEVLAGLVNFHNPQIIVLGGPFARLEEDLLSGIREITYQRALPLATRALRIETSLLGDDAALAGAIVLGRRTVFTPLGISRWGSNAA